MTWQASQIYSPEQRPVDFTWLRDVQSTTLKRDVSLGGSDSRVGFAILCQTAFTDLSRKLESDAMDSEQEAVHTVAFPDAFVVTFARVAMRSQGHSASAGAFATQRI